MAIRTTGWLGQNARGSFQYGNKSKLDAALAANAAHMGDPSGAETREAANLAQPTWREWYEDRRVPVCRDAPVDEALARMAKAVVIDSEYEN